jgi:thiamine transporter ThiT
MIERIAVYAALALVLSAVNAHWDTWQFWCILALMWASDVLAGRQGFELGVAQGMNAYSHATAEQRAAIDKIIKDNNND